jgi:hypothetical protein
MFITAISKHLQNKPEAALLVVGKYAVTFCVTGLYQPWA